MSGGDGRGYVKEDIVGIGKGNMRGMREGDMVRCGVPNYCEPATPLSIAVN